MSSEQIGDLTLGCTLTEARSQLTRLIAEGFQIHGTLQSDYETKFSAGTWDRQNGAKALRRRLEDWVNTTVKTVLCSIFPTRAEWDQVTTVERPVVFTGSGDSDVEGALQHFARILRELTTIRDSQLSSYEEPNKVEGPQQPTRESPGWQRLKIIEQTGGNDIILLDDAEYRVTSGSTKLLVALQEKQGAMVLAGILTTACGNRADRIYKSLPPELQSIIERPGKGKQGYRML